MPTTTISIGGKMGRHVMSTVTWNAFKVETLGAVRQSLVEDAQVVFTGTGTGRWTDEAGITETEPSFTVIVAGDLDHPALHDRLAGLARRYGQEAIAVTTGKTLFVGAQVHEEVSQTHAA